MAALRASAATLFLTSKTKWCGCSVFSVIHKSLVLEIWFKDFNRLCLEVAVGITHQVACSLVDGSQVRYFFETRTGRTVNPWLRMWENK